MDMGVLDKFIDYWRLKENNRHDERLKEFDLLKLKYQTENLKDAYSPDKQVFSRINELYKTPIVFISHDIKYKDRKNIIANALKNDFDIWLDKPDSSMSLRETIHKGILDSQYIVIHFCDVDSCLREEGGFPIEIEIISEYLNLVHKQRTKRKPVYVCYEMGISGESLMKQTKRQNPKVSKRIKDIIKGASGIYPNATECMTNLAPLISAISEEEKSRRNKNKVSSSR